MWKKLTLGLCVALVPAVMAMAEEQGSGPKELSGMSIVGNDDAPKSLYIVPWKSSEIGAETSLNRMLSEAAVPVDRDVFGRELAFYEVSTADRTPAHTASRARSAEPVAQVSTGRVSQHHFYSVAPKF